MVARPKVGCGVLILLILLSEALVILCCIKFLISSLESRDAQHRTRDSTRTVQRTLSVIVSLQLERGFASVNVSHQGSQNPRLRAQWDETDTALLGCVGCPLPPLLSTTLPLLRAHSQRGLPTLEGYTALIGDALQAIFLARLSGAAHAQALLAASVQVALAMESTASQRGAGALALAAHYGAHNTTLADYQGLFGTAAVRRFADITLAPSLSMSAAASAVVAADVGAAARRAGLEAVVRDVAATACLWSGAAASRSLAPAASLGLVEEWFGNVTADVSTLQAAVKTITSEAVVVAEGEMANASAWAGLALAGGVLAPLTTLLVIASLWWARDALQGAVRDILAPSGDQSCVLMFTDIQASTTLWAALGADMGRVVDAHNDAIRDAFDAHGVYEVKAIGDAFFAVATSPSCALRAALEIQQAMEEIDLGELDAPVRATYAGIGVLDSPSVVRVRIGLHWGTPIKVRDRGRVDYLGPCVNEAARIEACADGGTIVVSSALLAAMSRSELEEITHRSLGSVTLRGVPEPVELHLVGPPGQPLLRIPRLRMDVAAPRSAALIGHERQRRRVTPSRRSEGVSNSVSGSYVSCELPRIEPGTARGSAANTPTAPHPPHEPFGGLGSCPPPALAAAAAPARRSESGTDSASLRARPALSSPHSHSSSSHRHSPCSRAATAATSLKASSHGGSCGDDTPYRRSSSPQPPPGTAGRAPAPRVSSGGVGGARDESPPPLSAPVRAAAALRIQSPGGGGADAAYSDVSPQSPSALPLIPTAARASASGAAAVVVGVAAAGSGAG